MSLDDTLELETIIEESSKPLTPVTVNSSLGYNESGFGTYTYVFDPTESGTHKLSINGQQLTVEVTDPNDIPDSGLLYDYRFGGDLIDRTGTQNLLEYGTLSYDNNSEFDSQSLSANGTDNGAYAELSLVDNYDVFGYVVAFYPRETGSNYQYVCGNNSLNGVISAASGDIDGGIYTGSTNFQKVTATGEWDTNSWNVVGYYVDDLNNEQGIYSDSSSNATIDNLPDPVQDRNDTYWSVGTRTDDGSSFSNHLDTLVDIALIYNNKQSIVNAVDIVADAYGV